MIVDYHLHPRRPRADGVEELDHTVAAVDRYSEAAAARGIDEIALTEHVYYFRQTRAAWAVPYHLERCRHDLDAYVDAVLEAKRRALPVKLGLEVDWAPGREELLAEVLAPYPWDVLLGSVHFVDGLGIDGRPRLIDDVGADEAWRRYFRELAAAAASGLFDVLAHPDLVKIFGDRSPAAAGLYDEAADAIAAAGVAIEVSSAGLRKPVGELYPHPCLLEACRAGGVPVTLASDAHAAELVGADLDRAVALARAAGYDTVTVFEARARRQEPLG